VIFGIKWKFIKKISFSQLSLLMWVSPLAPIVKGQGLSLVKHKPLPFSLTMCSNGEKEGLQRQFNKIIRSKNYG